MVFSDKSFIRWIFIIPQKKKKIAGLPWWLSYLPMQEPWVWALIWKDPTCHRAAKPICHSLCSRAQEPQLLEPTHPRAWALQQEKPPQGAAQTQQLERGPHSQLEEKARTATKTQHSQKLIN